MFHFQQLAPSGGVSNLPFYPKRGRKAWVRSNKSRCAGPITQTAGWTTIEFKFCRRGATPISLKDRFVARNFNDASVWARGGKLEYCVLPAVWVNTGGVFIEPNAFVSKFGINWGWRVGGSFCELGTPSVFIKICCKTYVIRRLFWKNMSMLVAQKLYTSFRKIFFLPNRTTIVRLNIIWFISPWLLFLSQVIFLEILGCRP